MQNESQRNEETAGDGEGTPEDIKSTFPITVGPITVDVSHLQVSVNGKTLTLTGVEGHILNFLAIHANTVCTFSQIGSNVLGYYNDGAIVLIRIAIRHIRHKIEPDPNNPIYILTVPDTGYTLVSHDLAETKQKTLTDADI
jgi:DNA-binding response OmpR family regulator